MEKKEKNSQNDQKNHKFDFSKAITFCVQNLGVSPNAENISNKPIISVFEKCFSRKLFEKDSKYGQKIKCLTNPRAITFSIIKLGEAADAKELANTARSIL